MPRRRSFAPLRAVTLLALLCVLAMRVAIPTGYMWDNAGSGPALIACPADAPPMAMPAMHGAKHAPGHHKHQAPEHPCSFAAASAAADLTALPHDMPMPRARADAATVALHLFARPGLGLAAPPPPKTGPPAFA